MTHPAPSDPLARYEALLSDLDRLGLRRRTPAVDREARRSFCSNDYLGLAGQLRSAAPAGAGASRLIAGEHIEHAALERALERWLRAESALAFTSGYAANVGAVSALARPGDLVISDALNHASLVDGARLSRARVVITPHNDVGAVASALASRTEEHAWVLVESYYSMDADGPDLVRLRAACDEARAGLYVDEAHALGVFGPDGRGLAAEAGIVPDVVVGTLGKAFGSQGAFAVGRRPLRDWLWNRARSFVFSTGLSPAAAEAGRFAIEESIRSPERRERALHLSAMLRDGLRTLGLDVRGFGHVVPVVVGTSEAAVALSRALEQRGLAVPPIRPPTVAAGTARLRLTVTAAHSEADITFVLDAFRAIMSAP